MRSGDADERLSSGLEESVFSLEMVFFSKKYKWIKWEILYSGVSGGGGGGLTDLPHKYNK